LKRIRIFSQRRRCCFLNAAGKDDCGSNDEKYSIGINGDDWVEDIDKEYYTCDYEEMTCELFAENLVLNKMA
jgi:hypothetical protein